MEKRELSSTLRNLKFMQRAAQKEEKAKKVVVDQELIESSASLNSRKCIVILEGDPHPGGSMKGRMSFQNFNPSIDKLNEEPTEVAVNSTSVNQSGKTTSDHHHRDSNDDANNGGSHEEEEKRVTLQSHNGDLKRKQVEGGEVSEPPHPNKSPKIDQQHSSQRNHSSSSSKKKREKLDWNVLKPPSRRTY